MFPPEPQETIVEAAIRKISFSKKKRMFVIFFDNKLLGMTYLTNWLLFKRISSDIYDEFNNAGNSVCVKTMEAKPTRSMRTDFQNEFEALNCNWDNYLRFICYNEIQIYVVINDFGEFSENVEIYKDFCVYGSPAHVVFGEGKMVFIGRFFIFDLIKLFNSYKNKFRLNLRKKPSQTSSPNKSRL